MVRAFNLLSLSPVCRNNRTSPPQYDSFTPCTLSSAAQEYSFSPAYTGASSTCILPLESGPTQADYEFNLDDTLTAGDISFSTGQLAPLRRVPEVLL